MAEYQLQFATRHIRRAFERAIGRSIPKILTELITNADDSYRRLADAIKQGSVSRKIEDPAPITIIFERDHRRFSVIDQAEGLTDEEMKERLVIYGQESSDRSRGFRTRSLFGKGLRDVLFTQVKGQVKSIKDGRFYNSRFRWKEIDGNERPVVDIKSPSRVTAELRKALAITGDGTLVEFQLAESVRKPQPEKLVEKLNRFYMLRMINSSPHREVVLKTLRRGKVVSQDQLSYQFPLIEIVDRVEADMPTDDGGIIKIQGEIGLCEKELPQGEVGYEDREGGLLVLDEDDAVLDLWLFGFDEDPNARRISGILRLIGAGAYIRRKLNQLQPEEILTEAREGLDKNHPFYRQLRNIIQPRLAPIVASLRERGPQPKSTLSDRTRDRHRQALDILNRLYSQLLGKTGKVPNISAHSRVPPSEGIAFVNPHISIQAGILTPVPLLINPVLVRPDEMIALESDRPEIEVAPPVVTIVQSVSAQPVLIKIIRIRCFEPHMSWKITALWKAKEAVLSVATTDREVITPLNGLEFERDEYAVRLGSRRNLRLYVDINKVPLGSLINLTADGSGVRLIDRAVTVRESHLVTSTVAQIDITVHGVERKRIVIVTASHFAYVAGTKVTVVKKLKQERGKGGIFRDYRFEALERKVQTLFVPEGLILINTKDPVNQRYFGPEPYRAVEEYSHCQVRLADLVLNECLQIMVSDALEGGKLDRRFPNNPEIDIRYYVEEQKFEIGPQFHSLFVTKV